ncbi:hypothetical protein R6Q57_004805 [Mikania cordata]
MSVNVVIFFGGKWEFINGAIEYVPFDCFRRVCVLDTSFRFGTFIDLLCERCTLKKISRVSYKMSTFTDPIDILDDNDLSFFFNVVQNNPFEMFKLYVIEEQGVD